jgi:hypothetical protein
VQTFSVEKHAQRPEYVIIYVFVLGSPGPSLGPKKLAGGLIDNNANFSGDGVLMAL